MFVGRLEAVMGCVDMHACMYVYLPTYLPCIAAAPVAAPPAALAAAVPSAAASQRPLLFPPRRLWLPPTPLEYADAPAIDAKLIVNVPVRRRRRRLTASITAARLLASC